MGLGELKIDGVDGKLMEGTFNYNVANWQPQVSYEVDGSQPDKDSHSLPINGHTQ